MMKWYRNLYMGSMAKKHRRKIISNIKHGKKQIGVYVITLPSNDENVLDLYPSYILLQKHFRKIELNVLGIAVSRDEALEVVQDILMECFDRTGNFKVCNMIKKNEFK